MNEPKIIVIDDEAGIREGIRRALSPQALSVEIAENGAEGLRKIQSDGFELALIDVMMPGLSGIDLIGLIHQHDPELVCVIITGYATVELAVRAIKQGAYDFLTKPFSVDDLLLAVNQGLERRRLSLEAKRLQAIEVEARHLAEEAARLAELDKAKRQFIRLVTHELQTPVTAIESYLRLILEGYAPPEQQRDLLEKCLARAEEERQLIADLLELGYLQAIGRPPQTAPVRLDEILQQVVDALQSQAVQKNVGLSIEIAGEIPPVQGLAKQFKSLWTNLIDNAIKYTLPGGAVTAALRVEGDAVIGEVRDTGIGISPEDQKHLFIEFFRAKNAKALNLHGTGLGLVIVKRIIEAAEGKISVESVIERGTKFTFILPLVNDFLR